MFVDLPQTVSNRAAANVRAMHAEWQANIRIREQLFEVPQALLHMTRQSPKPPKQPEELDILDEDNLVNFTHEQDLPRVEWHGAGKRFKHHSYVSVRGQELKARTIMFESLKFETKCSRDDVRRFDVVIDVRSRCSMFETHFDRYYLSSGYQNSCYKNTVYIN